MSEEELQTLSDTKNSSSDDVLKLMRIRSFYCKVHDIDPNIPDDALLVNLNKALKRLSGRKTWSSVATTDKALLMFHDQYVLNPEGSFHKKWEKHQKDLSRKVQEPRDPQTHMIETLRPNHSNDDDGLDHKHVDTSAPTTDTPRRPLSPASSQSPIDYLEPSVRPTASLSSVATGIVLETPSVRFELKAETAPTDASANMDMDVDANDTNTAASTTTTSSSSSTSTSSSFSTNTSFAPRSKQNSLSSLYALDSFSTTKPSVKRSHVGLIDLREDSVPLRVPHSRRSLYDL